MSENKLLRRNFVIYVFNNFVTKKKILYTYHKNIDARYFVRSRIEVAIRKKYF